MSVGREDVVALTRAWIGTPYHHQASVKGVGCDCLGLIRGLYRELYACEAETPAAYTRDWCEASGTEAMLDAARRHLHEVDASSARPGDVVLFRIRRDAVAKHAAVLATPDMIIHAYEGAGAVVETSFSPWWRRRVAGVFRFDLEAAESPLPTSSWGEG